MTADDDSIKVDVTLQLQPTALAFLAGMAAGLEVSLPELLSALVSDAAAHVAGSDFGQLPAQVTVPDACHPLDLVRAIYRAPVDLD